ncbi:hypothetical protein DL93DRAFT_2091408 [Clavulina sp. PMI_390]|nr:hypothetical protein DL93DRAFT_2091408 [Clavulina sp. PMI_390]
MLYPKVPKGPKPFVLEYWVKEDQVRDQIRSALRLLHPDQSIHKIELGSSRDQQHWVSFGVDIDYVGLLYQFTTDRVVRAELVGEPLVIPSLGFLPNDAGFHDAKLHHRARLRRAILGYDLPDWDPSMVLERDGGFLSSYTCSLDYLRKVVGTEPPLPAGSSASSSRASSLSASRRRGVLSAREWTLLLRTELVLQMLLLYGASFDVPIFTTEALPYRRILHHLAACIAKDASTHPGTCSTRLEVFAKRERISFNQTTRHLSFTLAPHDQALRPLPRTRIDEWLRMEDAHVSERLRGTKPGASAPAAGSAPPP